MPLTPIHGLSNHEERIRSEALSLLDVFCFTFPHIPPSLPYISYDYPMGMLAVFYLLVLWHWQAYGGGISVDGSSSATVSSSSFTSCTATVSGHTCMLHPHQLTTRHTYPRDGPGPLMAHTSGLHYPLLPIYTCLSSSHPSILTHLPIHAH